MQQYKAAFDRYRASFPSDAFMKKYFGKNVSIAGNPHRAEVDTELYVRIRDVFDFVLRCAPRHRLRAEYWDERPGMVSIFTDGVPADWVEPALETHGLLVRLPAVAFRELCQEFIAHYQARAFHQHEWWRWQVEGESMWVEVIPEAIAAGKHKLKLSDVMGKPKSS